MSIIKSIYDTQGSSSLAITRQQELEYLEDLYKETLNTAAERHNARHPVKIGYRISFKPADEETMPFHVLTTDMQIDGVWHNISRIGEKLDKSNRIIPRLVVYRRAFAELAGHSIIFILSNKVDAVRLAYRGGEEATPAPSKEALPLTARKPGRPKKSSPEPQDISHVDIDPAA